MFMPSGPSGGGSSSHDRTYSLDRYFVRVYGREQKPIFRVTENVSVSSETREYLPDLLNSKYHALENAVDLLFLRDDLAILPDVESSGQWFQSIWDDKMVVTSSSFRLEVRLEVADDPEAFRLVNRALQEKALTLYCMPFKDHLGINFLFIFLSFWATFFFGQPLFMACLPLGLVWSICRLWLNHIRRARMESIFSREASQDGGAFGGGTKPTAEVTAGTESKCSCQARGLPGGQTSGAGNQHGHIGRFQ